MYYVGICIVAFFFSKYIELYSKKEKVRGLMQTIWENSYMRNDAQFGEFYLANAGIYYGRCFNSAVISVKLGRLSMYAGLSLVIGIAAAFAYGIVNLLTIEAIIVAALILLSNTCKFYSYKLTPDLLLDVLAQQYMSYTNKALVNTREIIEYDRIATEITRDGLSFYLASDID